MPEPDKVVAALDSAGFEWRMFRVGQLWFHAGEAMYVYWTPTFWRELTKEEGGRG